MSRSRIALQTIEQQSASALLTATLRFLKKNGITEELVLASAQHVYGSASHSPIGSAYKKQLRAYEEMGIVMSTWFNSKRFLDKECHPLPLKLGNASKSIGALVRASKVSITTKEAVELLRQSKSVKFDGIDTFCAMRREFVLPNFEVPRASLVVTRYLETLENNSSSKRGKAVLLLERNCHVPAIDLGTIGPTLRDIRGRGAAFLNAVNGDIEGRRIRGSLPRTAAEMSVHVFAWIRQLRATKRRRR